MRETVGHPTSSVALERHSALAIEMSGGFARVEVVEDRCQRIASPKVLGRNRIAAVHVDEKLSVRGEQRHLSRTIAPIGAVSVGVDQFTDRQPGRSPQPVTNWCGQRVKNL